MKKKIISKIVIILLTAMSLNAKSKKDNEIFIDNIDENLIIDKKTKILEEGIRIQIN